jgi:hypothetical protein
MTGALPPRRMLVGAIAAGGVAGVTMLLCLTVVNALLRTPGFSLEGQFRFDAATLFGTAAYTGKGYAALGVGLHFLVAIGWAGGYALAARRQPQLVRRPLISGAAFGLIVYFAMQLVLVGANLYRIPAPGELDVALLAHLGFYGIPVALITARTQGLG